MQIVDSFVLYNGVGEPNVMFQKKLRFVAASFLDWWMTVMLIGQCVFYESNPIANAFFLRWGYWGLLCYKLPPFLIIATTVTMIYKKGHRQVACAILDWGTIITLGVVFYGFSIFVTR